MQSGRQALSTHVSRNAVHLAVVRRTMLASDILQALVTEIHSGGSKTTSCCQKTVFPFAFAD
jgi:hypothetical protein